MRTLKDLTQDECIKIASLGEPDVEWKFTQSSDQWDGFDLVEKDCGNEQIAKYIFQIDYRSNEVIKSQHRFRVYEDLHEYTPNLEAILNYLKTIGCTAS
jgi:hypothetical protein